MEEEKKNIGTIRGTRHSIKLTKTVKNIPGFAPSHYDKVVGEVVFNFPHGEDRVYFQPGDNPPNVWGKRDIEQILEIMNRSFNESEWSDAWEEEKGNLEEPPN